MTEEPRAPVALLVGGSMYWHDEYVLAKLLCEKQHRPTVNFVCNDTIAVFPDTIHHAATLHPDKMPRWVQARVKLKDGLPPCRSWCHRRYPNFTDHTSDLGGSSGMFMVKIARELGFTHIILCGIPMTVEGKHFVRQQSWNAAHGFRRGAERVYLGARHHVRSMSGWTREMFGSPDSEWLRNDIIDQKSVFPQSTLGLRA